MKPLTIQRPVMLMFSHKVMSSLWPHELQHTRLPCTSLSPRVCSNSCPLSRWCKPTISSSVTPSPLGLNLSQHQCLSQCDICEGCSCLTSGGIQDYFIQEKEQVMNILHFLCSKSSTGLWRPLHILDLAHNSGTMVSLYTRCLKCLKEQARSLSQI